MPRIKGDWLMMGVDRRDPYTDATVGDGEVPPAISSMESARHAFFERDDALQ
jgi:hypothetical protein